MRWGKMISTKMSVDYGKGSIWIPPTTCQTSFNWASVNNFRPKSIYDLLSCLRFQTDLLFEYGSIPVVKGLKNYKENTASRRDFEKVRSAHFSSKSLGLPSRLTTKIYSITFLLHKNHAQFRKFYNLL